MGLVGPGNNGGDTLIALDSSRRRWLACLCLHRQTQQQNDDLVARLLEAGGEVVFAENDSDFSALAAYLESAEILLDGLLGTGIKLPLKAGDCRCCWSNLFSSWKTWMSRPTSSPWIVPPAWIATRAKPRWKCIPADLTVTMAAVKQGLLKLPAFEFVGDLTVVDIGLPDDLASFHDLKTEVADYDLVAGLLPERELDSHKGTFGTALIAAGSLNYTGAALLAATAAYRVGAGLVTLAVPEPLHAALAGQLPEATWVLLPHEAGFISEKASEILLNHVHRATAFLLGPGIGSHISTRKFVETVDLRCKTSHRCRCRWLASPRPNSRLAQKNISPRSPHAARRRNVRADGVIQRGNPGE